MSEQKTSSEDNLQVTGRWMVECPRCFDGTDPRAKPTQSCLVCWGERELDVRNQSWSGQHEKLIEHLLAHPRWDEVKGALRGC